jgi:hypothetical protein
MIIDYNKKDKLERKHVVNVTFHKKDTIKVILFFL